MEVGLVVDAPALLSREGDLDALAAAEHEGIGAIWIWEGGEEPGGALLLAAALAEATSRVRIGVATSPATTLHPLRLAEDLAMVDLVARGRVDFVPLDDAEADESGHGEWLSIVLRAWRGEPFAHTGPRHGFPELACWPRPAQTPHPLVWLRGDAPRPDEADAAMVGRWWEEGGSGLERWGSSASAVVRRVATGGPGGRVGTPVPTRARASGDAAAPATAAHGGWLLVGGPPGRSDAAQALSLAGRVLAERPAEPSPGPRGV